MDGYLTVVYLAIILLPPIGASPLIAERYVLRPVLMAVQKPTPRTNYMVGDIACLALYLSLAAMLVRLARFELINQRQEILVMAAAGLFVLCTWWLGVRSLSRARITDTLKRCVYLSVAVPLTYFGLVAVLPASILLLMAMTVRPPVQGVIGSLFTVITAGLFFCVGLILSRQIAHWVTAAPPPRESTSRPD